MNKKFVLFLMVILVSIPFFIIPTNAKTKVKSNILFISSYNSAFPTFFQQIDGVRTILTEHDAIIDIEFIDSKRFGEPENFDNFYNSINYKLKNNFHKYDAIITGDDNAYDFVIKYQNELFKDIPIVFFGINNLDKAIAAKSNPWVTGVAENRSVQDTIDIALRIIPNAKKIVTIGDSTESSIEDVKIVYSKAKLYPKIQFSDINLGNMTVDEFKIKMKSIDNDSIVLFTSAFRDVTGRAIEFEDGVKLVSDNCNQPIFDFQLQGIGDGILGGKVVSHIEQGKAAAEMVKEILLGTKIQEIPVMTISPNKYIFDYNKLKQFNISQTILPKDSIIINNPISFYAKYKNYIWTAMLIFLIMVIFIIYLLINIKFRKKAEKELINLNEELSATYEELEASSGELKAQYDEIQMQDQILAKSRESYKLICEASTGGTWDFDLKTKERVCTESWYSYYGFSKNDILIPDNWIKNIHHEDMDTFLNYKRSIKEGTKSKYSCEYRIIISDLEYRFFLEKCIVIRDEDGNIERIAGSHTDITEKKLQDEKIQKLAYYDSLTGLPNRTYLNNEFTSVLHSCNNRNNCGISILMDIDNFNLINDFFGHKTGDKVLTNIGKRLTKRFASDEKVFVSKSGGDEYILLINEVEDENKIKEYIDKTMKVFEEKIVIEDNKIYITASMGIVKFPQHGTTVEQLLKNEDTALYKAKDSGRNCYRVFEDEMNVAVSSKMILKSSLRDAVENEEFVLYYQPQIDSATGKLDGFEALIRWISPKHGFVSPDEFIKLAEETGIIVAIGKWVLKEACEFCKKINKESGDNYNIAINISPIELIQYEFIDNVKEIINKSGVNPAFLEFEITESSLMESFSANVEKLLLLKEVGISIALDDFGTGYSSLNYLKKLPIDILKIDKSFVDDLGLDDLEDNFVDIIINLAHRMGIKVVAEGVETKLQHRLLKKEKCDKFQGYLFSKPLPEASAIDFKENY